MRIYSRAEQVGHLRSLNSRDRLAIFVGAGVSFGCGLPTWSELIDRLIERAFPRARPEVRQALEGLALIPRTRLLRNKLGARFNEIVADSLYATAFQLSDAVRQIAACGARRMCVYNFDDVLEEALQLADVEFNSVCAGEPLNGNFSGTTVVHPHGYLTSTMTPEESRATTLVLSEEDYHALYSSPYSWANLVQLSLLSSSTCLFVGVSLTDPNLRRLLDVCASLRLTHGHYAIMRSPAYGVSRTEKALAKQVKAATEADLRSLGVEPIWVRSYDEIGDIFRAIRSTSPRTRRVSRPTSRGRTASVSSARRKSTPR
jgi:hypothetical protein